MKKIYFVFLCALFLIGCSNNQSVSTVDVSAEANEEKEVLLDENSFNFSLKTPEYDTENNSLLIDYETELPDGTIVELIINPSHPDSWGEQYDPFFEYTERLSQKVETEVKDGLISFKFDDTYFDSLLLPNSHFFMMLRIPVTEQKNAFIMDSIETEEDFKGMYPEIVKLQEENPYDSIFSFFETEDGYELQFHDEYEMTDAHPIEDIYAHYQKETIPFKELEKNPSKYEGTPVSFTGTVLQIQEVEKDVIDVDTVLRLAVNGNVDQVVYVTYNSSFGMEGVVSEDVITVYGEITGATTYESIAGYEITIPSMEALIYTE
ncbi:hypothetical protein [Bhargavaea beijingensis]|uniref:hypothetical protein n=1 Tax=Bhargavaea beijingensis TaxID=426756 RepID=UPI002224CEDC|nr:hypothetical protein [Bhargavaea beijingensis]MCW1929525.1 hypothetical protein [Bhargavaea beijingensis]